MFDASLENTVRFREIGTGISEARKRVPIFPFDTQGGKQASSYFRQRNWVQAREEEEEEEEEEGLFKADAVNERLRFGSLQADLSLMLPLGPAPPYTPYTCLIHVCMYTYLIHVCMYTHIHMYMYTAFAHIHTLCIHIFTCTWAHAILHA